jgi:hypothetical protein
VFGLYVICLFRKFLESENVWLFSTDKKISDDGFIARLSNRNNIDYYECVEQIYIPGTYIDRNKGININDFVLDCLSRKNEKGGDYAKNKSLFILCDIKSKNQRDYFEWQDFVKKFFIADTFLHLYFLSLLKHNPLFNEYYFLSFTNQVHRQKLNGEFKFKLNKNRIFDFVCTQKINLI